jgi:hypothetical protein
MKAILALAVAGSVLGGGAAAAAEPCAPSGKLHFVCDTLNSEDLVQVPGTKWLIASGFAGGGAPVGHLYLIDSENKTSRLLFPVGAPRLAPDKTAYPACPGAPDLGKFSTHGLNIRAAGDGSATLYVVNHGGREAIEFFRVDAKGAEPAATWVGCAVMPAHTWPNSVAPLPDGGMVVTSMFDPDDKQAPDKMNAGANTGAVYEWHAQGGFKQVPGSELSGDNGIEVSRDGKWLYVAAWGNKAVARLARGGGTGKPEMLPAGFLADNLRWAPDGRLLVAGQDVPAKDVFACFESRNTRCTQAWRVAAWDTAAMTLSPLLAEAGSAEFGDATVALDAGGTLFVGTFRGDRIAYLPAK